MTGKHSGRAIFVTRHAGALEWARRRGIEAEMMPHLDDETIESLGPGDTVMGVLPVSIAARVTARGARFFHLSLDVPPALRGKELSADDMERLGAELVEYEVRKKGKA